MQSVFMHLQRGIVLGSLLLLGCRSAAPYEQELTAPRTYSSQYRCGAKESDELILTLLPNHVFSLQQVDRDQACGHRVTLVYMGRWLVSSDGRQLSLDAGPAWLRRMDIENRKTFSFPDRPGVDALPSVPLAVDPRARLVPFREPFQLTGITVLVNLPE
ncbi:MAG: hypothetical protein ACJ8AX_08985 [Gemmatimonadales bacterium]